MKRTIERLREELARHNHKYYVENAPEIGDEQFDRMMRELSDLEAAHPEWDDPSSPTRRVGSDLSGGFETVAHGRPMLSLANTYSMDEVAEFSARVEKEGGNAHGGLSEGSETNGVDYVCELKFDGTAISLSYENGVLVRALTRGDGVAGENFRHGVMSMSLRGRFSRSQIMRSTPCS